MERIPQPIMDKRGEPHMKRFEEQRWLLDNIVRTNGIDWDQPRSLYISGPCGPEGGADIAGVRASHARHPGSCRTRLGEDPNGAAGGRAEPDGVSLTCIRPRHSIVTRSVVGGNSGQWSVASG